MLRKNDPPKVSFVRVKRQTLVSTLPTNGKVEPSEWQAVRAETGGIVSRVPVEEGQVVAAGAVLAGITDPSLQSDIDTAEAKVNEARANLASQEAGGKPADFTEIENSLARAQFDLEQAQKVPRQSAAPGGTTRRHPAGSGRSAPEGAADRTGNRRPRKAQRFAGFAHRSGGSPRPCRRRRDGARPGPRSAPLSCWSVRRSPA